MITYSFLKDDLCLDDIDIDTIVCGFFLFVLDVLLLPLELVLIIPYVIFIRILRKIAQKEDECND